MLYFWHPISYKEILQDESQYTAELLVCLKAQYLLQYYCCLSIQGESDVLVKCSHKNTALACTYSLLSLLCINKQINGDAVQPFILNCLALLFKIQHVVLFLIDRTEYKVMEVSALLNDSDSCAHKELSYLTTEELTILYCVSHRFSYMFDCELRIVEVEGQHYLIGVQISRLLQRETSNIYRSLKRAGIAIRRASSNQVCWLNSLDLGFVNGTHSVTFIPIRGALHYVNRGYAV